MSAPSPTDALQRCSTACEQALRAINEFVKLEPRSTGDIPTSDPALNMTVLRRDFLSLIAILDSHVTRLGMSLKPPVTTEGVIKSALDLSMDIGRLGSCAVSVPNSAGQTARKAMWWHAQDAIESIGNMSSALTIGLEANGGITPSNYMQIVGIVHSSLDRIKLTLPEDNLAAVRKQWKANSEMIGDALRELKEVMEESEAAKENAGEDDKDDGIEDEIFGDDIEERVMSVEEIQRTKKVYPLLHLTNLLHKKLDKHMRYFKSRSNSELDELLDTSNSLAANVDDLVGALSPSQDAQAIKHQVRLLSQRVKRLQSCLFLPDLTSNLAATSLSTETKADQQLGGNESDKWFKTCFEQISKAESAIG